MINVDPQRATRVGGNDVKAGVPQGSVLGPPTLYRSCPKAGFETFSHKTFSDVYVIIVQHVAQSSPPQNLQPSSLHTFNQNIHHFYYSCS